jgi:arabinan endo-1,5-alpha-L-arabinosidase
MKTFSFFLKPVRYAALILLLVSACKKKTGGDDGTVVQPPVTPTPAFDINAITDTYASVAAYDTRSQWGPYNTHDPSIVKAGDWYYCYSTDAAYGIGNLTPGLLVRKSKDLVNWQFVGTALNGIPTMGKNFITSMGATPNAGLWAPYVMKVGNEYRLYYSLASTGFRVSCIGLATSSLPDGPWVEKGLVVTSVTDGPGTNAIDPTVVVTPAGEHWMVYGSAWDGLFELQLNPATGLAMNSGDRGVRKVRRGITNGKYNGNLEGAEMIYNPDTKMYYLFVAYDWLSTKYNVRVFRSTSPTGPFLDWEGKDVDNQADNGPMIIAPYRFQGHSGWAGVSHCAVINDNGQFYIAHQGRPAVDRAYMVLHVRKLYWTTDGWPVASPERYAAVPSSAIAATDLSGEWEQIILGYRVVPGYDVEQSDPDYQAATTITLDAAGTINGNTGNTWTYTAPWLELKWSNGFTDNVRVDRERDWENKKNTIIFTGFNNAGTAIWGKKK